MRDDIKALRRGVTTLTVISVFVVAHFARDLILPILLGFLIALTLSPVNRSLQKFGLPAGISATLLIITTAAGIAGVLYFAGETASSWSQDAPQIARELEQKLRGVVEAVEAVQEASDQVEDMTTSPDTGPQTVVIHSQDCLTRL